eukprot:Hpha_TRINITY_DN14976_c0_g2::TRINITY_DN14976_c0_g2_i1::g.143215::m.143215
MVLGGLTCSLHQLERVAARWKTKVLTDAEAFASAFFRWDAELLGAVFVAKRSVHPLRLYGVGGQKEGTEEGGAEEWMYELARQAPGKFEASNDAKSAVITAKLEELRHKMGDAGGQQSKEEVGESCLWRIAEVGITAC